jgi:hypothetical protein
MVATDRAPSPTYRIKMAHRMKMVKALTDSAVSKLGPQRGQTGWREIADGGSIGLRLRISPTSEKVWALRYVVGGKRERHTLGAYPAVALSEARKRAMEYRSAGRDGVGAAEVEARVRALTLTVKTAYVEYISAVGGGLKKRTKALKEGMFRDHIAPVIGARFVHTIRHPDIALIDSKVAAKGFAVQCNRVFSEAMAFLRWCEQKGYVDGVPALRKKDLTRFLTERLRLTVNAAKSAVDRPWKRSFLGYSMTSHMKPRLRVAAKSVDRLRDKLRATFRQGRGRSIERTVETLTPILRGWINYFRLAQVKGTFEELDGWLRRKLRCILWRQRKRPRTRVQKLMARGLDELRAWHSAYNGRGPWWNAGASHMNEAYRKSDFVTLGLLSFQELHSRLNHAP